MPQALDDCVTGLLNKWKSDPSSKPTPKAGQDDESMAYAICRSTLKLEEEQDRILLEKVGPTLVAVAATAKPHLRQRGKEIRIVEKDGRKVVEVPILRKGIYRHPKGKLVFNDRFVNKLIENHRSKVTDYPVHLDFRHSDKEGALAFLDPEDGGWLELKDDGWLYAYGQPSDEQAEQMINSRKWRHASPEFWLNYESNLVTTRLSADDLEELRPEQLMEEIMHKEIKFGDIVIKLEQTDDVFTLDGEAVESLDAIAAKLTELAGLAQKVADLEAKLAGLAQEKQELERKLEQTEDVEDIPEPLKLRLEALESRNRQLEEQRHKERVALTLERARSYRDSRGYGHAVPLLELVEHGLLMRQFDGADGPVKLESNTGESAVSYYQNLLKRILEINPGTVPMEDNTEGDDYHLENNRRYSFSEDELKEALKEFERY